MVEMDQQPVAIPFDLVKPVCWAAVSLGFGKIEARLDAVWHGIEGKLRLRRIAKSSTSAAQRGILPE
ncbi:hypothetical protein ACDY97_26890 [Rhizobium mongolense]|uniref:hypothetical protein n=1 Tax=Rhizobium mongolense TaxID=57676 RepID=UPI00355618BB